MIASIGSPIKPLRLLSVLALLLLWELLARFIPAVFPSTVEILSALLRLAYSGEIGQHLITSLQRTIIGLFVGAALGFITGAVAGLFRPVYLFLKPLISFLQASPAVVIVMLALVWFGVGSTMPIFVTALFTVPILYVSLVEGMQIVDRDILEMASVYRVSRWNRWWHLYLPALSTSLVAGITFAAGTGFRKTVMAELLGSDHGIGYAMAITRFTFDMPRFFAWVVLCVVVSLLLELLVVRPLATRVNRWRDHDAKRGVSYE